jgi:uncharacterized protein (TIGR02646 family)
VIRIARGEEPRELAAVRERELPVVRAIASARSPRSDEIKGYGVAKPALMRAQESKCCYCEQLIEGRFDDVEHWRPKTQANRGEGFPTHGYWWLAWTWSNLLLACKTCNSGHKRDAFPLEPRSVALLPEGIPPGGERPLLLDPSAEDPLEHIEFRQAERGTWRPVARGGSRRGDTTIRALGLDRPHLLDLYRWHVNERVRPAIDRVLLAADFGVARDVNAAWQTALRRLLRTSHPLAALSYDALGALVPATTRTEWRLDLLRPPIGDVEIP